MPNLPSFRPRGTLGTVEGGNRVKASAEFLRYLDELRQTVDVDGNIVVQNVTDIAALTARVAALEQADLDSPVAVYETPKTEFNPV